MKKNLITTILFLLTLTIFAQEPISKLELEAQAGWNSPYGNGLAVRYNLDDFSIDGGVGLAMIGVRYNLGWKYVINKEQKWSPFLGVDYSHTSAVSELTISNEHEEAIFEFDDADQIHFGGGMRYKASFGNLNFRVGYGVLLSDSEAYFKDGDYNPDMFDIADILIPGGLEISISLSFPLSMLFI